jgi:cation transporter-like permease
VNADRDEQSSGHYYRAQVDFDLEELRAVNAAGQSAIKSSMLVNGGAAVALLAFIGHLATDPQTIGAVPNFAVPLTSFVVGVWLGGLSAGFTYLTAAGRSVKLGDPDRKPTPKWTTLSRITNYLAIVCGALSLLVCFPTGFYFAYKSFVRLPVNAAATTIKQ